MSIYQVLYKKPAGTDSAFLGKKIFEKVPVDALVLYSSKESIAFNKEGKVASNSFFIKNPRDIHRGR